jgi:hypothetical protein
MEIHVVSIFMVGEQSKKKDSSACCLLHSDLLRNLKPGMTVLARASGNLTERTDREWNADY